MKKYIFLLLNQILDNILLFLSYLRVINLKFNFNFIIVWSFH